MSNFALNLQSKRSLTKENEAKEEADDMHHDLQIAASIGKQLMDENIQLKADLERMVHLEDQVRRKTRVT